MSAETQAETEQLETLKEKLASTGLPISEFLYTYPATTQECVYRYLCQLTEIDRMAYRIAYEAMESSFNVVRTSGFVKWQNKQAAAVVATTAV